MSVNCKILNLTYLNKKTLSVSLEAEGDFDFLAGQYVLLELGESGKLPFLIASLPKDNRKFELHFGGVSEESSLASSIMYLQQRFKNRETVVVEGAKGDAWLRSTDGHPRANAANRQIMFERRYQPKRKKQRQDEEEQGYKWFR